MRYSILTIAVLLLACGKDETGLDALILGHAGVGRDLVNTVEAPDSREAIELALGHYQMDGVEVDIQFTMDSVPVLYQDHLLEEGTNKTGKVHERMWSDVSGAKFRGRQAQIEGASLINLEDLFDLLDQYPRAIASLDIRSINPNMDFSMVAYVLDSFIQAYQMDERVYLESSNPMTLKAIKMKNPTLRCLWNSTLSEEKRQRCLDYGFEGVIWPFTRITEEEIDRFHESGLIVACFGQLIPADLRSIVSQKADILQVENPVLSSRF